VIFEIDGEDDRNLVIESKRSEMSIVLFFVGIFSKEGLSLVEIAVAIGVSTTVISLQNLTIRPATCRNMSEPFNSWGCAATQSIIDMRLKLTPSFRF
jgi:hypothetical protein